MDEMRQSNIMVPCEINNPMEYALDEIFDNPIGYLVFGADTY